MTRGEQVNPTVLVWARESAGLGLKDAAQRIGLSSSIDSSSEGKLIELEQGTRLPSRTQLSKIAQAYRRPLLTFYMETPPRRGERGSDFRSTGSQATRRENALLDALLRDIKARQEMVRSLLEDDEPTVRRFVGSCSLTDSVDTVAERISSELGISTDKGERGCSAEELFKRLRSQAEAQGIFVLLVGDLGSHHSALSEEVFRGFAIADEIAPFIAINDHDARGCHQIGYMREHGQILA